QQRALLQEAFQIDRRFGDRRSIAMGALRVDLMRGKPTQHQQRRHHEGRGDEEYRLRREEIAASAHHAGREAGADRGEACIAAAPATTLSERAASTSAPPGTWPISATRPATVITRPMSNWVHFCVVR